MFERSSALTQAAVKWVVSEAFREMEAWRWDTEPQNSRVFGCFFGKEGLWSLVTARLLRFGCLDKLSFCHLGLIILSPFSISTMNTGICPGSSKTLWKWSWTLSMRRQLFVARSHAEAQYSGKSYCWNLALINSSYPVPRIQPKGSGWLPSWNYQPGCQALLVPSW